MFTIEISFSHFEWKCFITRRVWHTRKRSKDGTVKISVLISVILTNCRCERSVLGDLTLCVNACLTPLNGLMKGMTLCHSVIITLCHFFHQSFTRVRSLSTDLSMTQQGIEYDVNLEDSFYHRLLSWRHLYLYIQVGLICCALLCNWLSTGVSGARPDFTGAFSTAEWQPSQINQNNCIQTVKPLNSYCKITLLYLSIKRHAY